MAKVTGEGTIVQLEKDKPKNKCRKWRLRVSTGFDPRTGKYKIKTRRVSNMSYTQAKKAMRDFIEEIEADRVQSRTSWTVEDYCAAYLDRRRQSREIAQETIYRQQCQFNAVNHHIGKMNLAAVTPEVLDGMYAAMLAGDTLSGRPSHGSYVAQIHSNMNLVFSQAVEEGILVSNPVHAAHPPQWDSEERRAIRPEDVQTFVENLDPRNERECAFMLAITLGLRRGEISGLSWGDVDFAEKTLCIRHSYDRFRNLKITKTRAGSRLLPLTDATCEALAARKAAQAERFAKIESERNYERRPHLEKLEQTDETPVITSRCANRALPTTVGRWWTNDRKKYGLDGWTLHELRHTYLTLLAKNGVHPKVMQLLAGHSSFQTTMNIYTHIDMSEKRKAAQAVSSVFEGLGQTAE